MAARHRSARWVAALVCGISLAACTSSHGSNSADASRGAAGSSSKTTPSTSALSASAPTVATSQAVISTPASSSPSPSALIAVVPSRTPAPGPTPAPSPTLPPKASAKPIVATPSKTTPAAALQQLLVEQLASVGDAQQVVIVTSSTWSTIHATLQTFQKDATGWHAVFASMPALIGRSGFAATRTEGDGTTPSGKYSFGTMFGQLANPGVRFPYRQPDAQSVWVGDSTSPYYNTWQENAALDGEHLAAAGFAKSYAYAVAINFNTAPVVPHKGSAIFLHVSTGSATAGCVSIAQSNLLQVLRWLDPARSPVIVMGPTSVIRQY